MQDATERRSGDQGNNSQGSHAACNLLIALAMCTPIPLSISWDCPCGLVLITNMHPSRLPSLQTHCWSATAVLHFRNWVEISVSAADLMARKMHPRSQQLFEQGRQSKVYKMNPNWEPSVWGNISLSSGKEKRLP